MGDGDAAILERLDHGRGRRRAADHDALQMSEIELVGL